MNQGSIRITDVITTQYADFLSYCADAGREYLSDLSEVDYVAFRSRYGRSREYVAEIKALIAALPAGGIPSGEAENSEEPDEEKEASAPAAAREPPAADVSPAENSSEKVQEKRSYIHSEEPLSQVFCVNADDYASVSIDELVLSVRATNVLKRARMMTISDILCRSLNDLKQLRNMGQKTLKEIVQVLGAFVAAPRDAGYQPTGASRTQPVPGQTPELKRLDEETRKAVEAILTGEEFAAETLSEPQLAYCEKVREAVETVGSEMCMEMYLNPQYIHQVCASLLDFASDSLRFSEASYLIARHMSHLPASVKQRKAVPYIRAYNAKTRGSILYHVSIFNEDTRIADIPRLCEKIRGMQAAGDIFRELNGFFAWLEFDGKDPIRSTVDSILETTKKGPQRSFEILALRAEGKTLEEIGRQFGVTRERVRQIENKMQKRFWYRYDYQRYDLLLLISAMRDGDMILHYQELEDILAEFTPILWSCVKMNISHKWFYYSRLLDAIVIRADDGTNQDESDLSEKLCHAHAALPNVFMVSEKEALLSQLASEYGVPLEALEDYFNSSYQQAGKFFHRGRLTTIFMCEYVLKTRFPAGYKIADGFEANRFRQYLMEFFGDGNTITDRALDTKISGIGVLCGRGKYIHPDFLQVEPEIIEKVNDYIEASPRSLLTYGEIFDALQDLLAGTQITNRYLLQGAMKKYGCRFSTGRDFVRKVQSVTLADELEAFVEARGVVHKSEIFAEFTSLGDAGLGQIVGRCSHVFNIDGGYYIHASQFDIRPEDYEPVRLYLTQACEDVPVHIRTVHEELSIRLPEFIYRNDFDDKNKLHAALIFMFREEFSFSRHFIAKLGTSSLTNRDVLLQHIADYDSIELEELLAISEDNNIRFLGTSVLYQSLMPEFLRIDKTTLMRRELTGVTDEVAARTAELVQEMLASRDYIVGAAVDDFLWFPEIDVDWNEFLLESVVLLGKRIHTVFLIGDPLRHPNTVYVTDAYKDDNFESFLLKLLTEEVRRGSFTTKAEMRDWLQEAHLIEGKLPRFLERDTYFICDETGVHCTEGR